MQQKPVSNIVAGAIIGAALVFFALVFTLTKNDTLASFQWIKYIIIIGGLIFFINSHARSLNNNVTFGNLFAYGFKTTAVFTLIMISFVGIYYALSPELKEEGLRMIRERLEENKKMSESDIDKMVKFSRDYFWLLTLGGVLLEHIIIGAIGSLIGAAVTKKNPQQPVDQLDL